MSSVGNPARRRNELWRQPVVLLITVAFIFIARQTFAQNTNAPETTTHVDDATFTLRTERNTVLVPVIVRNSKGEAVDHLRQEDFRLYDRGKSQPILSFSIERPATAANAPALSKPEATSGKQTGAEAPADRFVALYFDDINSSESDLAHTRQAAARYLGSSVGPGDRIGLFTASGRKQVDFTANVGLIQQALENLHPHLDPTFSSVPPYLAYLVVEQNDQTALSLLVCRPNESPDNCSTTSVQALAQANLSLDFANSLSLSVLRGLNIIIRQMSTLPGQRTLVILSAGFQTWSTTFLSQIDQIVDEAIRAHVVINSLDARGLYGDLSVTDLNDSGPRTQDRLLMDLITVNPMLRDGEVRLPDAMRAFAHDTGGIIVENSNDFNAGIRQTTGVPEVLYLLAFSPQNLRHDGAFHGLKVSLVSSHGLSLQARHGYFAPRKSEDLAAQEKEEMRDAVFSLDEAHTLPLDVHTQFFMASQSDARVTVLTHIDLHTLRFRKDAGRNFDKLTLVTVLFDLDGNEVDAQKKIFEFQTHDAVLEKYLHSGITLDGRFNLKPGKYRVRTVLRESESGQLASLNRSFEIPY